MQPITRNNLPKKLAKMIAAQAARMTLAKRQRAELGEREIVSRVSAGMKWRKARHQTQRCHK
jgi:hypothetical protein